MAGVKNTGPNVSMGPMAGMIPPAQPQEYSNEMGANIGYQGEAFPDCRFPINKDNPTPGSILCHLSNPQIISVDAFPSGQQNLTVAGAATNGTPFALVSTYAAGIALNMPMINAATQQVVSGILGLDIGFTTLNVTSGNPVATIAGSATNSNAWKFAVGMWLTIAGIGTAGATMICQVTAMGGTWAAPTVTLSPTPITSQAAAPVGMTNQLNPLTYGNPAALAYQPRIAGGLAAPLDPGQCIMRGVGVLGSASATGGNVLVRGIDTYGFLQSEIIAAPTSAIVAYGKKTYKGIISATPQFTDAGHNYTLQTSDLFGFMCRSDEWELMSIFYNGAFITGGSSPTSTPANTAIAWAPGDQTNPATTATTDPRGTIQVSGRGPTSGVTTGTNVSGTQRLMIAQSINVANMVYATPWNPSPLYGVTPV